MSTKHFFPETHGVVLHALNALAVRNPHLALDPIHRVIYSRTHSPSKVTLISGGGSGHEPAWSGYVGDGMLTAAVSGEIFASPSTKQIMSAIKNAPSEEGIILCITNYTGDNLHFGLAREKGVGLGYNISVVSMAEDAALGRKKAGLVGRRGLAGNLVVLKLLGAASESGWSFEKCLKLGNLGNSQLVTIGTSLDHCHVPGRTHHEPVPENACELGMGIHNEPGLRTISPQPSPEDIVNEMLLYLLDPNDEDRAFVKFDPKDETVLLINNFGGLSTLETEAMANVTLQQLAKNWSIKPTRVYSGIFETSLNAPGFSITLGNISGIAKAMEMSTSEVLQLLDAPTSAPAWPKDNYSHAKTSKEADELRERIAAKADAKRSESEGPEITSTILSAIQAACKRAIAAEPEITKFDIQMGDGDCGEAVETGCKSILERFSAHDLEASTPIFTVLSHIEESVEDVGGSLGAIISILITSFGNSLRKAHSGDQSSFQLNAATAGEAAGQALENLKLYTNARVGDRTVMDVLIPFCEALEKSSDLRTAVEAAEKGAEATRGMKAKFGRATYIGDERLEGDKKEELPPDPGAYAASVFLRGLFEGLGQ